MQPCNEHSRSTVSGDARQRCRSWREGMLCCSMMYKAEKTIKSIMTNDLDKSCEVCFTARLSFRASNVRDRDVVEENR